MGNLKKITRPGNTGGKSLSGIIFRTLFVLILVGLLELMAGYTLLRRYHAQLEEMEEKLTETYMDQINENFRKLNTVLRSMIYDGSEIQAVLDTLKQYGYEESLRNILEKNEAIIDLKDSFSTMSQTYGSSYNFFYYDPSSEKMVEYGGSSYDVRVPFIELIEEKIQEGTLSYTKNNKWFLCEEYICSIYKSSNGIIGAWVRIEDFVEDMFAQSPFSNASIEIYDEVSGQALVYSLNENGALELSVLEDSLGSYYFIQYASFGCQFAVNTGLYDGAMFSLMLFLGLIMVYVGIVAAVIIYMNKNVLRQINTFYDALMGYRPAFRFCEENSYVEFAEAGHVLNQLTDEIQALKIDVYEEQLARQKVELDYLQIQIRPHFYINCLNVIYSMAQVNRTTEIQELALSVTKYLRYIFQKSMEPVSVRAELEFVENYLHVLECMGSIKCECHIMLEDAMREFGIPPLLIQTFVENSIKHNMESETPIRITIAVEEVSMDGKKECRIVIGDTGRGFQENDLADFNAGIFSGGSGYHIGLSNAVARLNLFYHSSAHLKFYNADEGGAIVEILIAM